MKILLVCSAGMSTSLLVNSMKNFKQEGDVIEAKSVSELEAVIDNYDVILVGPQIRYKMAEIENACKKHNKSVGLMEMRAYGQRDGDAVMKQAKELLHEEDKK